ncbi:nitronate monooxygenase [Nicoliella spurrieriana]|uniref:Probable nitronate monooxygenase n=1 Tax=Nicoliella spurrieriana TaxID=2925830 RepID=A0A976RTC9_9LACO|nr:nitronate monooxygenase [Nicoliella spurrieriana]UQS87324.1 nitronate monooxygenase [Nicoliella spurrieriana]
MKTQAKMVTDILKIKYPIIQGPMSWITNAEFVSAVSNAGGLGVLGANAGQRQKADGPADAAEKMRREIRRVHTLTNHSFGINIVMHDASDDVSEYTQLMLNTAFEEGVHYFVTVGAPNPVVFDQIKAHHGVIIHRPLTPTVANMQAAEANGADILVATGCEAGGVYPNQRVSTAEIIAKVVDHVHVPVMAAGGINSVDDIRALESYHVAGLFVGTLFIATTESPLAASAKRLIIQSKSGDLIDVSAKLRSINTAKAKRLNRAFTNADSNVDVNAEIKKMGGMKRGMLDGEIDDGIVSVNTKIDSINQERSVAELMVTLGHSWEIVMNHDVSMASE